MREGRANFSRREGWATCAQRTGAMCVQGRGNLKIQRMGGTMRTCREVGTTLEYRERSKLAAIEPGDHQQRSHWLLPSDRYAYAHINTPSLGQTSFSNGIRQRRSDYESIYNN